MTNKPLVITAGLPTATQLSSTDLSDGPSLPLAGGAMTGGITLKDGTIAAQAIVAAATGWGQYHEASTPFQAQNAPIAWSDGTKFIAGIATVGYQQAITGGGSSNLLVMGEGNVAPIFRRFSTDISAPTFSLQKARGTIVSPVVPATSDRIGDYGVSMWTSGTTFSQCGFMRYTCVETSAVDSTHLGTKWELQLCPIGSGTLTNVLTATNEAGLSMFGANPVIDQNRTHIHRGYTIGTLPAAVTGGMIYCSDLGGGGSLLQSDGTNWKRLGINSYEARSLATGAESLNTLTNANYVNYTATLTGNVTVTLGTTNAYKGAVFIIRNKGTGAFTFAIVNGGAGAGTLVTFAASTAKEATCVYDGTNWVLMQDSLI